MKERELMSDSMHLTSAQTHWRFVPLLLIRRSHVKETAGRTGILLAAAVAFASSTVLTGCQTTIGGQTLPSATYLDDDVGYFPAGPEFKLTQQEEATQQFRTEQQRLQSGL